MHTHSVHTDMHTRGTHTHTHAGRVLDVCIFSTHTTASTHTSIQTPCTNRCASAHTHSHYSIHTPTHTHTHIQSHTTMSILKTNLQRTSPYTFSSGQTPGSEGEDWMMKGSASHITPCGSPGERQACLSDLHLPKLPQGPSSLGSTIPPPAPR